jgi:hypothetical protein
MQLHTLSQILLHKETPGIRRRAERLNPDLRFSLLENLLPDPKRRRLEG